ncbi:TetR/AcrR family transcriptional regulator [Nonomuraea lactucae]|uniref:TetR/AcrR family transcriptional regulator n=1 Tax=Nonomuraea lactucae TaxID=2249762 RepID=UPI000DE23127|nr:TetR/AcrR family transcriptional regulator [Nonomuraea lactucae]
MTTRDLRARNHDRVREDLGRAAIALLLEEGYAHVTADAIAARAGMSLRTLYRHFPSKEDVAAAYFHRSDSARVDRLRELGASLGPLDALLAAVEHGWELDAGWLTSDTLTHLSKIILNEPALRAANLRLIAQHQADLADALAARPDFGPERRVKAELTVAAFYGALQVAERRWLSEDGTTLDDFVMLVRRYVELLPEALREATGARA